METKTAAFVLSHAGCYDGAAAAYAAWQSLGSDAQYHFLSHYDPLPGIPDGADVYILDYWRSPTELRSLLGRGCTITVLDHHETAMIDALRFMGQLRNCKPKNLILESDADYSAFNRQAEWQALGLDSDNALKGISFQDWEQEKLEDLVLALKLRKLQIRSGDGDLLISFNLERSGAAIAWDHFCPGLPVPDLIRYVEDRDLWRWALPDSEAVSDALGELIGGFRRERREAALRAIACQLYEKNPNQPIFAGFNPSTATSLMSPHLRQVCEAELELESRRNSQAEAIAEFMELHSLANLSDFSERLAERGKPLVQPRRDAVAKMCRQVFWCEILGHRVPVVRAERYYSWVGSELCRMFPNAPFSVTYRSGCEGYIKVDLRSRNGFRVNRVACKLGGGGHPPAAGFTIQQCHTLAAGDRFINVASTGEYFWSIPVFTMSQVLQLRPDGRAEALGNHNQVVTVAPDAWIIKLK